MEPNYDKREATMMVGKFELLVTNDWIILKIIPLRLSGKKDSLSNGVLWASIFFSKIGTRANNSPLKKRFSWETGC